MFSPTGYYARMSVRRGHEPTTIDDTRPILHWNDEGKPIIADEGGELVTPEQYLAPYVDEGEIGSFEVHP